MIPKHAYIRRLKLTAATVLALGMLSTAGHAYTLEQQEMCAGDAMRLCSSEIPDVGRITACMERQRDSLSDRCKAVFEVDTPATSAETVVDDTPTKISKPINLRPKLKRG
jgi:hypothetical protein